MAAGSRLAWSKGKAGTLTTGLKARLSVPVVAVVASVRKAADALVTKIDLSQFAAGHIFVKSER